MKTDIKKDQKVLKSIVQRYGKDDVLKYLNEGFNDSFDDNESDYTDIMNDNDNNTRKIMVIKSILSGKNTSMAINLNNHNIRNVAKQYEQLYTSTIKPMEDVANGKVQYSDFWANEKKIGGRNLADLLLESLSYKKSEIADMQASKKAAAINSALQKKGKLNTFYNIIVVHWLDNIFKEPESDFEQSLKKQPKENYGDLKTLFHNLKHNGESEFVEFLKSKKADIGKIGNNKVIDIMLEAVQDDDENYLDKDIAFKKKALIAYAEFPDMREKAINAVFGDYKVPVSTTKAVTGHTLGAAAALEAAICYKALIDNYDKNCNNVILPGQIWDKEQDPELPVLNIVDGTVETTKPLKVCLSNSFAFGGANACLAIGF